jgi:hypothetical protein
MKRIVFVPVIAVIVAAALLHRNGAESPRPEPRQAPATTLALPAAAATYESRAQPAVVIPPRAELFSASGAPVDLDGLTVRGFIDRWSRAARIGDADAAYRVYEAEALCARAAENEQMLRTQSLAPDDGLREAIEASNETLAALCNGVSPAEIAERLVFLTQAARSGNAHAQLDFYAEGPSGRLYEWRADERDPNVGTWKSQAIAFLKQAAMQNNRDALEALAVAYFNGVVVPQDFETSLTYEIALARASHKDPELALLATQLIERLPESVVARARDAGEALYQQCCSDRGS